MCKNLKQQTNALVRNTFYAVILVVAVFDPRRQYGRPISRGAKAIPAAVVTAFSPNHEGPSD